MWHRTNRSDDAVSIRDFRSTSVFPVNDDVRWLRERICQIANVSLSQLEPTKISSYTRGQYFAKHTDASFLQEKLWAFSARLAGVDDEGVQDPCSWPSRFCVRGSESNPLLSPCPSIAHGRRQLTEDCTARIVIADAILVFERRA